MKTIFEKIRDKEIPSYMIYEDDFVMAFLDITQATKGHTLIVPKKAYRDLGETPDHELSHMMYVTKKVIKALKQTLKPEGFNVLNNLGEIAGQTIFHVHFHVIPRYEKDDLELAFIPKVTPTSDDFNSLHQLLKAALL